nr:RNA-directed DNA polymerase, eukaryota, nucleotide-binding alpha-beta plait domain protein [Tanacetum cinerariifolium]
MILEEKDRFQDGIIDMRMKTTGASRIWLYPYHFLIYYFLRDWPSMDTLADTMDKLEIALKRLTTSTAHLISITAKTTTVNYTITRTELKDDTINNKHHPTTIDRETTTCMNDTKDISIFYPPTLHKSYNSVRFIKQKLATIQVRFSYSNCLSRFKQPKFVFLRPEHEPPWKPPGYKIMSLEDKARFEARSIDTCNRPTVEEFVNNLIFHNRCTFALEVSCIFLGDHALFFGYLSIALWNVMREENELEKSKAEKRLAFVRFIKVDNVDRLVGNLCTLWIGRMHLHANVVRFERTPSQVPRPSQSVRKATHTGNTFAYVVKGNLISPMSSSPALVLDDTCLEDRDYENCVMGKILQFSSISNLRILLFHDGFLSVRTVYLGRLWVMTELNSPETKNKLMNHVGVASWYKSLHNVQAEFVAKERIVWIDIEGVPANRLMQPI